MSPSLLIAIIAGYFLLLLALAAATSRGADNESFFIGNRRSHWLLVAFGMVGTSLSGVTFISVPGTVAANGFGYFQVVVGNWIGFLLIAAVLLPLYYRHRLTSIYDYLDRRFGVTAHRTGAAFFLLSRTLGATARLYLVVNVLHILVGAPAGIPFWLVTAVILAMIWCYTFRGGVRTIVFTDTLQTACMLSGLAICIYFLVQALGGDGGLLATRLADSPATTIWNTDVNAAGFWLKQIVGGAVIAIAMSGLDQEMMQKNISVARLADSQKNMALFSLVLVGVNLLFLILGALLLWFATANGVTARGDELFPTVVMQYFPAWVQAVFFIALISALFPSADGALTALTSSFCVDILRLTPRNDGAAARTDRDITRIRQAVHLGFALLFFALVLVFKWLDDRSIIDTILKLAGYTYGPLLGLFAFGMWTARRLPHRAAFLTAMLLPPLLTWGLQTVLANRDGYRIGIELLLINGLLTFALLWCVSAAPPRYKD